jgi:hypothetical protein
MLIAPEQLLGAREATAMRAMESAPADEAAPLARAA